MQQRFDDEKDSFLQWQVNGSQQYALVMLNGFFHSIDLFFANTRGNES